MSESVKRAAVVFATVLFAALSVCSFAAPFCGVAEGTASSSVVMDAASGRVLGGSGYHTRGYPASTTKILTALVVLERTEPECVVTVPDEAVGVEGSSIYLRKGEKLTVEDLLYGLMLRSGNDAAVALAVATAGSVERFAAMMNARAAMCGAKDSHFVNPHGLHDDDHYTTAYDMALIAAEAYRNPLFARIVSTSKITVGEGESTRCLYNKNKLLGMIDGANGVKTGYTKKSGRCLVGGAFRDGMQLVSVVLNIPDMWQVTTALLENAFEEYEAVPVLSLPQGSAEGWTEASYTLDRHGNPSPALYPVRRSGEKIRAVLRTP